MGINWVEDPKIRLEQKARHTENGCIEWTGHVHNQGYGRTTLGYKNYVFVHRLAYALAHNLDPLNFDGFVLHSCDNRLCYNPEHLRLGTHADNTKDMLDRKRNAKGERIPYAKLTDAKVAAILKDPRKHSEIAAAYNVSQTTILHVKQRKIWKHVPSDAPPYVAQPGIGTPVRSKNPRRY